MWLEREQNLSRRIPESSQITNQEQTLSSINPVSYSLPLVTPAPQQQGISLEDMQKAIQNALAQQKTENQALVKKVTELESQMAKQTQVPVSQTVKPVRQPRGPPSSLQMEEGIENYNLTQYLHGLDDNEDGEGEYNEEENRWHAPSQSEKKLVLSVDNNNSYNVMPPKTYDQLMNSLSPAMQKNITINDLTISNSFLDPGSEFGAVNDATIKALEWENDKQSDFAIKSDNSKHITKSLGWIIDVPVSIKDKAEKTVTVSGNFARINNGEPEPMLCLGMTWIRKVQGILDPNRNQFRMKLHGKTYTIPTFSKALKVSELEQQVSDMHHGKDLKKNA
ncbi:hypothetical protein C2G38_2222777 [Gigaspora rosea]|uniref:Uncharacterized protein n=1 Tax=Gigaspora rosea TaxID=44941 RepID=A0A397U587_9GLOM|nr:hypothetical protein C2G38_2222777 [Gigaspora rosea]